MNATTLKALSTAALVAATLTGCDKPASTEAPSAPPPAPAPAAVPAAPAAAEPAPAAAADAPGAQPEAAAEPAAGGDVPPSGARLTLPDRKGLPELQRAMKLPQLQLRHLPKPDQTKPQGQ